VRIDGPSRAAGAPVPDTVEQLLAGERALRAAGERGEQLELRRRQPDLFGAAEQPARVQVDRELADRHSGRRCRLSRARGAAQDGVDAGDELARTEGLGHVVVGTDPQADEDIGLGVARGEEENRDGMVGLDPAARVDPVEPGEHPVEDHQVWPEPPAELHAVGAAGGELDAEAFGAQSRRNGLRDPRLVLDDRDGRARCHGTRC
jgi:hypothetical protein